MNKPKHGCIRLLRSSKIVLLICCCATLLNPIRVVAQSAVTSSAAENSQIADLSEEDKAAALVEALSNKNSEVVKLLLDAGADPNGVAEGPSPILTAIENTDTASTLVLFEAGAVGPKTIKRNTLQELIYENKFEIVNALVANGLELELPRSRSSALKPLHLALAKQQSEMAIALLPYSDPRIVSEAPITRAKSDIKFRILPRSNALFLANLLHAKQTPSLPLMIQKRTAELGGKEAVVLSHLQAELSMSEFLVYEGNFADAYELIANELDNLSINDIQSSKDINVVNTVKVMLAKKHELSIINGKPFSEKDRSLAQELAASGESTAHWHLMLDTINHALSGDYAAQLEDWQSQFQGTRTDEWDFSRLNNWISSIGNESVQKRLYRAVDYFEFSIGSSL